MNNSTITLEQFFIIGISVRTTNENQQAMQDIGNLWAKFMNQNLIQQIPNKINDDIYCLYTEYASDFTGPYTTYLGCRVSSLEHIPEDFVTLNVPSNTYKEYIIPQGNTDAVGATWSEIWESGMTRDYQVDFDVYTTKGEVRIYVG